MMRNTEKMGGEQKEKEIMINGKTKTNKYNWKL